MAIVDPNDGLVFKVLVAGPPASGKSTFIHAMGRILEDCEHFELTQFPLGPQTGIRGRWTQQYPCKLEVYEWHGPEHLDRRGRALLVGLDGLIYVADARPERWVDTKLGLDDLMQRVGRRTLHSRATLLVRGRPDLGLLTLPFIERELSAVRWTGRFFDEDLGRVDIALSPFIRAMHNR